MGSKVLLMILDGVGVGKENKYDTTKYLTSMYNLSKCKLKASGKHVGLPNGFIGNSEVGHTHIGSGKLIDQDLIRINKSIKDKSFFKNKTLLDSLNKIKKSNNALHLIGLCSDAGVHSHINHLFALLELAKKVKLKEVYIHVFTDGRDTPVKSGIKYIKNIEKFCSKLGIGKIASIIGRYYAMDRDKRWGREHIAYECLVNNKGKKFFSSKKAIEFAYSQGQTDEFIKPLIINKNRLKNKDCIVFFNFRSDRARQLTTAFTDNKFNYFKKSKIKVDFICLTEYDKKIKAKVLFPLEIPKNSLGEIISKNNLKQLRIAETEKYAHVTFFFNGGREKPFSKEKRILIDSPKVSTYDKKPEMSALKITKALLPTIGKYDLTVMNFANGDMVGHTGNLEKTIEAIKILNKCIRIIKKKCLNKKINLIITSDHGNCEDMEGNSATTHTKNDVNLFINKKIKLKKGALHNIAPTILELMRLKKPKEMSESLIIPT